MKIKDFEIKGIADVTETLAKLAIINNVVGGNAFEFSGYLSEDVGEITFGGFHIRIEYVIGLDIMSATLRYKNKYSIFNFHPFKPLGGLDIEMFECEFKDCYNRLMDK